MDKVVREYKKTKQAARRLGRAIRKQEKKHRSELDRAREATKQAKAEGAALHARLSELLHLQRQLLDRLDNEGEDSSAGIDKEESDKVAAEILDVCYCGCGAKSDDECIECHKRGKRGCIAVARYADRFSEVVCRDCFIKCCDPGDVFSHVCAECQKFVAEAKPVQ